MNQDFLKIYTDYLISTFGSATATGLVSMLDDAVSHDQVTRFLSGRDHTSRRKVSRYRHLTLTTYQLLPGRERRQREVILQAPL
jgi:hypothetical protein